MKTDGIETKFKLLKAIDRSIESMSVDEICEKAGVSRPTFYNHFKSKHDMLPWWTAWCEQFFLDQIGRTLSWEEGYPNHFRLMSVGASFLEKGLQGGARSPYFGGYAVPLRRKKIITRTLVEYRGVKVDDELNYYIEAFTHLESETFIKWCKEGFPFGFVTQSKLLLGVVPPKLYNALQLPDARGKTQTEIIDNFDKILAEVNMSTHEMVQKGITDEKNIAEFLLLFRSQAGK